MIIEFKNRVGGSKVSSLRNKIKEKYNLNEEVIDEIIADAMLDQYNEGYIDYKRLQKDVLEKIRLSLITSKCKIISIYRDMPARISQDEPYERIVKRSFNKLYDKEQGIILECIIKGYDEDTDIEEYNLAIKKLSSIISEDDEFLANTVLNKLCIKTKKKKK